MTTLTNSGLVHQVLTFWNEKGLAHNEGLSAAVLDSFEQKHAIQLPESFRQLYLATDGTEVMDAHEIIFDQLLSIDQSYLKKETEYVSIVFASFRLCQYMYQLRLKHGNEQEIYILDFFFKELAYLGNSFDTFLEVYLHEPAELTRKF